MDHAPFSNVGLEPEQLEKEKVLVLKSIDQTQEAIKEIDFNLIREIIREIYRKVAPSLSEDELNKIFLLNEDIPIDVKYTEYLSLDSNYGANTSSTHVAAYASGRKVTIFARENVDERGEMSLESKLCLLKNLIHEILHTHTICVLEDEETGEVKEYSGISYKEETVQDTGDPGNGDPFILLNEAMTELLADAIFSEYLARSGRLKDYREMRKWYQRPDVAERKQTYIPERMALMYLVDRIENYTGISAEKIYQAFVVEYLRSGDLTRNEIMKECKDSSEIRNLLILLKNNDPVVFRQYSAQEESSLRSLLDSKQLDYIKAIVGRDYIGNTNQQRQAKKRFFNVLH